MVWPNLRTRILTKRHVILVAVPIRLTAFFLQVAGLCFFFIVGNVITLAVLLLVLAAVQIVAGIGAGAVSCHLFILHVIHAA